MAADFTVLCSHRWINNFVKYLINSKKIQKNVKFGLQAHINMENKMNGSDRLFEFWNFKFGPCVFRLICFQKHISHLSFSLSLYIYIYELWCIVMYSLFCTLDYKSPDSKSKWPIQMVNLVLHIYMYLETKFYIFWNFFFYIYWKSLFFYGPDLSENSNFK